MSSSFELPELAPPRPAGEARAEAAAEREAALSRARADGYEEGLSAGLERVRASAEAFAAAAAALAEERDRAAAASEAAAVELALAIAEKVLGAALEARPELVVEVMRGALRRITDPLPATLLVNPADAERMRAAVAELEGEFGAALKVRAERRVQPGSAIVRTAAGEVDAQVAEQLRRAGEVIAAELGGT
jgi:flagellar assembly protein FliH